MKEYKMYKQIFSLRLAGYLMMNGFPIKRIHHNLKKRDKDVYLFEDTPEITQAILKYKEFIMYKGENYADFNKRSRSNTYGENNSTL